VGFEVRRSRFGEHRIGNPVQMRMEVQNVETQEIDAADSEVDSPARKARYEEVVGPARGNKNPGRARRRRRIMMISTHGYVSANPEFGVRDTGGQVVYVLELSKALARMGYYVDIYTRRFEGQPQEEPVADRVRVLRIPCGGAEFIPKETLCDSIPEWVTNAIQFMERKRLNYGFINSHYWDGGLAGQGIANHFDIPHIHTPHSIGSWKRDNMDGDPEELEKTYNFARRIREEKIIYDECDIVAATTPAQRHILDKGEYDVPVEKIRTLPPGYDDLRFFPVSKAQKTAIKREYGYEGRIILALGRMARNKGYDLLLKAMPVVFERVKDARLLLAPGSAEPDAEEEKGVVRLRELAQKLKIAEKMIIRGYIPDDDLENHYRIADVFALSSRYEPFGMTAVEAMACGTPTVITTQGGLWEQVEWGREALYADPFDPEFFGYTICSILQLPEVAERLARFGPQKARSRFTWMGIAQQMLRTIKDIPLPMLEDLPQ